MKNLILLFTFLTITTIVEAQSINLCNIEITSISLTGDVGLSENGLDTSKTCITISGFADICDENGKVIGSGLTLTLQSSGCRADRLSGSSSPNQLFMPLELLGEAPEFEGIEIPLVYPNPNSGVFTLKTKTKDLTNAITIVSLSSGTKVKPQIANTAKGYTIDLSQYPSGIYVLQYNKDGLEFSQKIIKQ